MFKSNLQKFFRNNIHILIIGCIISGCAGAPFLDHLAGKNLATAPSFLHKEVFFEGEDLWVGVDPNRYPSKVGQAYNIYVAEHKDYNQWKTNPNLVDITGNIENKTLVVGGLSANRTKAWSNMTLPAMVHNWHKQYDVVFDFNTNGIYDPAVDILDRIGTLEDLNAEESGGFTLIKDPVQTGDFPVGTHDYDEGNFIVNVPAAYQEGGDPLNIVRRGRMYYPATIAGSNTPVNTDLANYPLVIMAHGRSSNPSSWQGYDYLCRHLASRGYVCVSIDLYGLVNGWRIHHRGVTILEHVNRMLFAATADPIINDVRIRMDPARVAFIGHSRGGEGVVAANTIYNGLVNPGYALKAVISYSPTDGPDWTEDNPSGGPYTPTVPYLMMYGTRDGDLSGSAGNVGYRIADRAAYPRFSVSIYGANHNYWNQVWSTDGAPFISRAQQETQGKVHILSFLEAYLNKHQAYSTIFSGYSNPNSITSIGTTIQYSYQPEGLGVHYVVDNAEDLPVNPNVNSLGLANVNTALFSYDELSLRYDAIPTRNYFIHDTNGLSASWNAPGSSLTFQVGNLAGLYYDFLSFRVGQRFRNPNNLNPVNNDQNFSVILTDTSGNSSPPVVVSNFTKIPYSEDRGAYTKSILQTVTLPLRAFTANGSNVDIRHLASIRFDFNQTGIGEILIDDVQFQGLDITEPDL